MANGNDNTLFEIGSKKYSKLYRQSDKKLLTLGISLILKHKKILFISILNG